MSPVGFAHNTLVLGGSVELNVTSFILLLDIASTSMIYKLNKGRG
nr:MAG TPA: hypothetical protein [Crassvirales sp.]